MAVDARHVLRELKRDGAASDGIFSVKREHEISRDLQDAFLPARRKLKAELSQAESRLSGAKKSLRDAEYDLKWYTQRVTSWHAENKFHSMISKFFSDKRPIDVKEKEAAIPRLKEEIEKLRGIIASTSEFIANAMKEIRRLTVEFSTHPQVKPILQREIRIQERILEILASEPLQESKLRPPVKSTEKAADANFTPAAPEPAPKPEIALPAPSEPSEPAIEEEEEAEPDWSSWSTPTP